MQKSSQVQHLEMQVDSHHHEGFESDVDQYFRPQSPQDNEKQDVLRRRRRRRLLVQNPNELTKSAIDENHHPKRRRPGKEEDLDGTAMRSVRKGGEFRHRASTVTDDPFHDSEDEVRRGGGLKSCLKRNDESMGRSSSASDVPTETSNDSVIEEMPNEMNPVGEGMAEDLFESEKEEDDDEDDGLEPAFWEQTSKSSFEASESGQSNRVSSFSDCLNLLSLYAIHRRLVARQRRIPPARPRVAALSGCLYHVPQSVPSPPSALPENTPVWARLVDNMPPQPPQVYDDSYPWHLAKIVYSRPAPGFALGYIHGNGEAENMGDYLVEWAVGPPHLRTSLSTTASTPAGPPVTRNQGVPTIERRSSSTLYKGTQSPDLNKRTTVAGKDGDPDDSMQRQDSFGQSSIPSPSSPPPADVTEEDKQEESYPFLAPALGLNNFSVSLLSSRGQPGTGLASSEILKTPPPLTLSATQHTLTPADIRMDSRHMSQQHPTNKRKLSHDMAETAEELDNHSSYLACSPWHFEYYVHYQAFNRRYDRWCSLNELLPIVIDPKTLQLSPKAVARQLLSGLNGIAHPSVSSNPVKPDVLSPSPLKIGGKPAPCDVANILLLSILRSSCGIFSMWEDQNDGDDVVEECPLVGSQARRNRKRQGESASIEMTSVRSDASDISASASDHGTQNGKNLNKIKSSWDSLLQWCLSFLGRCRGHRGKKRKKRETITSVPESTVEVAKLWWSVVISAHFQIDIIEIQAALYSNAKKKRKHGNVTHPFTGPNVALLASCPSEHVLGALEGSCGISVQCLNDRDTPMTVKWKHIKGLESFERVNSSDISNRSCSVEMYPPIRSSTNSSLTSPTDEDGSMETQSVISKRLEDPSSGNNPQISRLFSSIPKLSKFDLSKHPVLPEITPFLSLQLQKVLNVSLEIAKRRTGHRRQRKASEADEPTKTESPGLCQNPSGLDCFDMVESDAGEHEGLDKSSIEAHESATKLRTIESIQINHYIVPTWYYSPFPLTVQPTQCLLICGGCLEFFTTEAGLTHHEALCSRFTPPGPEIYRDGHLSFFEIDGEVEWAYCENLSLLAKLFLDHKTLQYSVTPFLFYVLVEWDDTPTPAQEDSPQSVLLRKAGLTPARNNQIVGYFSKEKESSMGYNLACILTLPQHQRKGYGKYFIHFSYALSKIERKVGTPERPLSDLGRVSYSQYWKLVLAEFLLSPANQPPACTCLFSEVADSLSAGLCDLTCRHLDLENALEYGHDSPPRMGELSLSIDDFAHFTSLRNDDISTTLEAMGVLRRNAETGDFVLVFDENWLIEVRKQCGRPPPPVLPENFVWAPLNTSLYSTASSTTPPSEAFTTIPMFDHDAVPTPRKRFHFPHFERCPHYW